MGTIEPFDGDDFSDYSERLDSYLFANNIGKVAADANEDTKKEADSQKVATKISVIGKKAYKVLKDLCLPEKPTDKSYKHVQLKEILTNFYKPKLLEVAESYRFNHTIQKKCFICDFTQHLADKCSYVNATCYSCHKKGHLSKACFKRKK